MATDFECCAPLTAGRLLCELIGGLATWARLPLARGTKQPLTFAWKLDCANQQADKPTTRKSAMSTPVGVPHPELPANLATSPGQKRKRASDSSSPDTRRSKRGAPAAAMATTESDAHQAVQVAQAQAAQVTQTAQAAQSFLENTVSIAQAAHEHVNVDDFSALAQATAADHSETTDAANATNTAAAALNMYPNLHVSQPTTEPFSNQPAQEAHQENTFNNHSINQPAPAEPMPVAQPTSMPAPATPAPANGVQQHPVQQHPVQQHPVQQQQPQAPPHPQTHPQYKPPNPKPAVGSEEWHKMRKDNHKEGKPSRNTSLQLASRVNIAGS